MLYDYTVLYLLAPVIAGLVAAYIIGWRRIHHRIHEYHHPYAWIIKDRFVGGRYWRRIIDLVLVSIILLMLITALSLPHTISHRSLVKESSIYGSVSFKRRIPVVIVLDTSGSMAGIKYYYAVQAVSLFIEKISGSILLGLITFDGDVKHAIPPTTDYWRIINVLKREKPSGGTVYSIPLKTALEWLKPYREFNLSALVIFVTDGLPYEGDVPVYKGILSEYYDEGIPIYAIFIFTPGSTDINRIGESVVREIAYATGGDWYTVEEAPELIQVFQKLAEETITLSGNYTLRYSINYEVETINYYIHIPATIAFITLIIYYTVRLFLYRTSF